MRYLVNGQEMKEIDRRSIEDYGIPSLVLMERAALKVAKEAESILMERFGTLRKRVCAVCGLGNNGADGAAVARMLFLHGASVSVLLPEFEGKMSREMEVQLSIVKKLGIPVYEAENFEEESCDLIIDAVFGIGLTRPVGGRYQTMIEWINAQEDAVVISVDIPCCFSNLRYRRTGTPISSTLPIIIILSGRRRKQAAMLSI